MNDALAINAVAVVVAVTVFLRWPTAVGGMPLTQANTIECSGSLSTADSIYNYPQTRLPTCPSLSTDPAYYDEYQFTVTHNDTTWFFSICTSDGAWADFDSLLVLYHTPSVPLSDPFDPTQPYENTLSWNDHSCGSLESRLSLTGDAALDSGRPAVRRM